MSKMHKYACRIRWTHRKWGPQQQKQTAEGTSVRRAISHALLAFFSDATNRDRRRDAHAQIEVEAWRLKKQ
jgi:hypothetical protein